MKQSMGRYRWLGLTVALALIAAAVRRWQLATAFEEELGLPVRGAPASIVLVCALVISAALFLALAMGQRISRQSRAPGQVHRWEMALLDPEDKVYPAAMVAGAFFAVAAVPLLLGRGIEAWRMFRAGYQQSDNGVLTIATGVTAILAFLGLLQMGRDGLHGRRERGKGGFSAAMPAITGCLWLMEGFRAHAADPVLWDYVPLLLAISAGILFYLDCAGMSTSGARPRRLLWLCGMTVVLSVVELISGCRLADALLLGAQTLAALAVLWRLPRNLENSTRRRAREPVRREAEEEERPYE